MMPIVSGSQWFQEVSGFRKSVVSGNQWFQKINGFRKGVRGRTLFPLEKGLPRRNCREKWIFLLGILPVDKLLGI